MDNSWEQQLFLCLKIYCFMNLYFMTFFSIDEEPSDQVPYSMSNQVVLDKEPIDHVLLQESLMMKNSHSGGNPTANDAITEPFVKNDSCNKKLLVTELINRSTTIVDNLEQTGSLTSPCITNFSLGHSDLLSSHSLLELNSPALQLPASLVISDNQHSYHQPISSLTQKHLSSQYNSTTHISNHGLIYSQSKITTGHEGNKLPIVQCKDHFLSRPQVFAAGSQYVDTISRDEYSLHTVISGHKGSLSLSTIDVEEESLNLDANCIQASRSTSSNKKGPFGSKVLKHTSASSKPGNCHGIIEDAFDALLNNRPSGAATDLISYLPPLGPTAPESVGELHMYR